MIACGNCAGGRLVVGVLAGAVLAGGVLAGGVGVRNPHGTTTAGWPVRFGIVKLALPGAGETKTSQFAISLSISRINRVRARCARRYSTAGMNRAVRKVFGQSPGFCPDS